jgi:hypothetical protein
MQAFENQSFKAIYLKSACYSKGRIRIRLCCKLFKLTSTNQIDEQLIKMMHRFVLHEIQKVKRI